MKKVINIFGLAFFLLNAGLVYSQQTLDLRAAIQSAATKIEQEIGSGKKVALLNFISSSQDLSTYVIDELMDIFTNNKVLEVAERYRLDAILKERNYQTSGEVSDDDIKSIGNQIGAKYVVTGQLNYDGLSYRFRIYAIDIEEGTRVASTSVNIRNNDQQLAYFLGGTQSGNRTNGTGSQSIPVPVNNDWTNRRWYIGGWGGGGTWTYGAGGVVLFTAELNIAKYFGLDFDIGAKIGETGWGIISPTGTIFAHIPIRFSFGLDVGIIGGIFGGDPNYFGGGGGLSLGFRIGNGEIFGKFIYLQGIYGDGGIIGGLGYKVGVGNR